MSASPSPTIVRRSMFRSLFIAFLTVAVSATAGTVVEIRMPIGTIGLELYDEDKPITVSNFLSYINSGRYENAFAHRLDPGFVLQGGGYTLENNTVTPVDTFDQIQNEYSAGTTYSNTYGTVAMARVGGQVNSATSQWFINLGNNTFLDGVDEGFTVFGKVISGFDVMERLNTTFADENEDEDMVGDAREALGSTFGELPLLFPSLEIEALLHTEIVVVPPPSITVQPPSIRTPKKIVARHGRAKIKGSLGGDVAKVEVKAGRGGYKKARIRGSRFIFLAKGLADRSKFTAMVRTTGTDGSRLINKVTITVRK